MKRNQSAVRTSLSVLAAKIVAALVSARRRCGGIGVVQFAGIEEEPMRMNKLASRTALSVAIVACWLSTSSRAQTEPQDLCPPLEKARQLGHPEIFDTGPPKKCSTICEVDVKVTMENNICVARVVKEVIIEKKRSRKPRGDVPEITWKIVPDPALSDQKFEFHKDHGIRFLPPKYSNEKPNLESKDFHTKDPGKQMFKWKNHHSRKVRVRYCPYVERVYNNQDGTEIREVCEGRDPLILNE